VVILYITCVVAHKKLAYNHLKDMTLRKEMWILAALIFLIGWTAGFFYSKKSAADAPSFEIVRENSQEYRYINPILYTDNSDIKYRQLNPLKNKFADYIEKIKRNGNADRISVYFRDLSTNMWTGVGEDELYVPSSMLKTLTLIMYLKLAENDPYIFDEQLFYKKSVNQNAHYPPTETLEDGMYDTRVLIGRSIIYSDNDAHDALTAVVEKKLDNFYAEMKLPKRPDKLQDFFSPRAMSRIFRTLFNSSYLSESYSEQAMELLAKTVFVKGLVSGVEPGIAIAHKFGEYTKYPDVPQGKISHQLHDCGIIYYPDKPYVLCVMTEGNNFDNLETAISDISKIAFLYVKG
jgi:beta-lactamase class A